MAQSSNAFPGYGTSVVVGPQFCSPNPIDLIITRRLLKMTEANFTVEDVYGNVMFKIKEPVQLRIGRVLCDAQGKPIVTMREKMMSTHGRWKAFRGKSTKSKDLLFSAKRSSIIQLKTTLDVFLASNGNESKHDFKVKGSWSESSCVIYGAKKVVIAKMRNISTVGNELLGKDKLMVTVNPNVDCAFVVALIVILDAINKVITVSNND